VYHAFFVARNPDCPVTPPVDEGRMTDKVRKMADQSPFDWIGLDAQSCMIHPGE
jgi:hypothetical protein